MFKKKKEPVDLVIQQRLKLLKAVDKLIESAQNNIDWNMAEIEKAELNRVRILDEIQRLKNEGL